VIENILKDARIGIKF